MKQIVCIILFVWVLGLFSQTPTYEFFTEPIDIITNYYDYMPGSYNALPIQIEQDGSAYIVFHGRETPQSTRRIYYAYIAANGILVEVDMIGSSDIHEGYAGIDLDPVSGDPFVGWHGNHDPVSADLEVVLSYDLYHQGSSGFWRTPFAVIDDNTPSYNMPADCFIWPEVHIGHSPIPDKRRVYVIGKNAAGSPINAHPSENVLIAYADFDEADLEAQSELDWTFRTIPLLDEWHNGDPEWVRPFVSVSVSDDGQIALMGYTQIDWALPNLTDRLIVLYNNNFGAGDFEFYSLDAQFNVWNPTPGSPDDLYFAPNFCHHQNSFFHDGNSKISFMGMMNLLIEPNIWNQDENQLYPKIFTFDLQSQEFSFYDLYIEGANPADDLPMIPWDLDENGIVDSIGPNGEILYVEGWPIYDFDPDMAFNENNFKITQNEEKGWLATVWGDGLKCRKAYQGAPGFAIWEDNPEIGICISADNGESWSQPIFLNVLETPEFEDMTPEYVYPGDKIEDLGNEHGKLHLFFLDDYEYGNNFTGAMQKYCSLDIDFGDFTSSPEITVPTAQLDLTNYPNPFNPSTTISFNLTAKDSKSAKVVIYNLKGQRICQFSIFNNQSSITWDGTDQVGKPVSSGIYFCNLIVDGKMLKSKKMMLIK